MSAPAAKSFYRAGGTLPADWPSYVERPADDELLRHILQGTFCYVLTPRQTGKSSLMVRTMSHLKGRGIRTAAIDLTQIGTVPAEKWYLALLLLLQSKLRLPVDAEAWWQQRDSLSPVQRFTDFFREVVLDKIPEHMVIFVDEIDATLKLDFADDFFAAIRSIYNARAHNPAFNRLTFVLLGVAAPNDLIRDPQRTPFNIGTPIDLSDFTRRDTQSLRFGLDQAHPDKSEAVFDRIFYWTGGHPYLTQKLCASMLEVSAEEWNAEGVNRLAHKLFISNRTGLDANLQVIHDSIAASPQRDKLFSLYREVYKGRRVAEDERSPEQNCLKLFGLVRTKDGFLQVRNEIYRRVFDDNWIKKNAPAKRRPWIAGVVIALVVLVAGVLFGYNSWQQWQNAQMQSATFIEQFNKNSSSSIRIQSLAGLLKLSNQEATARGLFNSLSQADKRALFNLSDPKAVAPQLVAVVKILYTDLPNDADGNTFLLSMYTPLKTLDDPTARSLAAEIEQWLQGRSSFNDGQDAQAIAAYSTAIDKLNPRNPGTHLDRAKAYARQGKDSPALEDLEAVLGLDSGQLWKERVQQVVQANPGLYEAVWPQKNKYMSIASLVSTPTNTPTLKTTVTQRPSPTPSAAATPTTSPPAAPMATFTPTPPPAQANTATARTSASIYVAPMSDSQELGIVQTGERVTVTGRSDPAYGTWLFVQTAQGKEGFVYATRFDWSGDWAKLRVVAAIVTIVPQAVSPAASQDPCKSPVTFRWTGELLWHQAYKVVIRYDSPDYERFVTLIESPLIGKDDVVFRTESWQTNVPDKFRAEGQDFSVIGALEWQILVINKDTGQTVTHSDWFKFKFSPLTGQLCP